MRLVFIRHGDPDYTRDTLTAKGWREAEALVPRFQEMPMREIYCSPLGRAQDTAAPLLRAVHRRPTIRPWLQEFFYCIADPNTGKPRIPWDFMPDFWTNIPQLYDKDNWAKHPIMQTGPVEEAWHTVCCGLDTLLAENGYIREGGLYRAESSSRDTLVFFCHLGVQFVMLGHLLGIAPPVLWQGFYVAPSSVTTLESEEVIPGRAYFRLRCLGDTQHLSDAGEPVSDAGFFGLKGNESAHEVSSGC